MGSHQQQRRRYRKFSARGGDEKGSGVAVGLSPPPPKPRVSEAPPLEQSLLLSRGSDRSISSCQTGNSSRRVAMFPQHCFEERYVDGDGGGGKREGKEAVGHDEDQVDIETLWKMNLEEKEEEEDTDDDYSSTAESKPCIDDAKMKEMRMKKMMKRFQETLPGGGELTNTGAIFDESVKFIKLLQQRVDNLGLRRP